MDVISSDGTWMVHDVIDFHHVLSSDHDGTWMVHGCIYMYIYICIYIWFATKKYLLS